MQYLNKKIQKYVPKLLNTAEPGTFNDVWFEFNHLCQQLFAAYVCGEL
jgi:hypothetical protein